MHTLFTPSTSLFVYACRVCDRATTCDAIVVSKVRAWDACVRAIKNSTARQRKGLRTFASSQSHVCSDRVLQEPNRVVRKACSILLASTRCKKTHDYGASWWRGGSERSKDSGGSSAATHARFRGGSMHAFALDIFTESLVSLRSGCVGI